MSEQPIEMVEAGDIDPENDGPLEDAVEGTTEDGTPVVSEWDSESETAS